MDTGLLEILLAPLSEKQHVHPIDGGACTADVIDGDRDTTGSKEGGPTSTRRIQIKLQHTQRDGGAQAEPRQSGEEGWDGVKNGLWKNIFVSPIQSRLVC